MTRRRLRNPSATGALLGAIMPYAFASGIAYLLYEKYLAPSAGSAPDDPNAAGPGDTSAAHTVQQLISNPSNELDVLGNDVSQSVSGVSGLVSNEFTSLENGVNSWWQNL